MIPADKTEIVKTLLFTTVLGLWLYWLWMRRNLYRFAFEFPGLVGVPLIGSLHRIKHTNNLVPAVEKMFADTKRHTICVWLGLQPFLLTEEPEFIEKVLASPHLLNKSKNFYTPIYNAMNGGIFASPVEKWHHNRKLITPSFSHKVVVTFFPVFNKWTKLALSKLDALVGKGEHELGDMLTQLSMGISCETTMGIIMKEENKLHIHLATQLTYMMKSVMVQATLSFIYLSGIISLSKRFRKTKQELQHIIEEIFRKKLSNLEENSVTERPEITETRENNEQSGDSMPTITKTPTIFINQALKIYQNQQFSWNDLVSESFAILIGSFETTATAMLNTLVMLAMHPEVQEKLYEEIVNVFPDKNFEMEYEHTKQLQYMDMVINEVLRLMPSVPGIARHVVQDTQLTKDLLLPKNLQIIISLFHLHRRTDIWGPNAAKFNPDNFLPENMAGKHSHAYIPFLKGSRNCIGQRYAMLSMKIMISGLVRNNRFTTTYKYEDLQFVTHITLKFLVEPKIEIHRR